jgi:hypothetical protein
MSDVGVFDLLALLEKRGIVKSTDQNTTYCDCCGKQHFRQWYRNERTGDSFYVCTSVMLGMVKYVSGDWGQIALIDLVEKLI